MSIVLDTEVDDPAFDPTCCMGGLIGEMSRAAPETETAPNETDVKRVQIKLNPIHKQFENGNGRSAGRPNRSRPQVASRCSPCSSIAFPVGAEPFQFAPAVDLPPATKEVLSCAFNPVRESMIAFAANDGTVLVYELEGRRGSVGCPRLIEERDICVQTNRRQALSPPPVLPPFVAHQSE